jgi:predicted ester cyclase
MRMSIVVLASLCLFAGCDKHEDAGKTAKAAKPDTKTKFDAPSDAKAGPAQPEVARPEPEPTPAPKAEPTDPNDHEPRGKADDPASAKAIEEFTKSREEKRIEVTAKPGTPDWFVQALEAFRAGDIDPIVANFAADITWDAVGSPLEPPSVGKAAVMARWEDLLIGIPDMKLHARRIFHHGNLVVMQVVLTGTHKGTFRGIAPTEKPVGAEVLAWVWHDADGKADKVRVVYDEATLLSQMGKLEGQAAAPIPEVPTAAPEIITGDDDAAAIKVLKSIYAAGKNAWKLCSTKLCVPGVVHHDMRGGKDITTAEEHEAGHKAFFAAFPDMRLSIADVSSFGAGWVVVFAHAKGTHKGELGSLPPTKKKVDFGYAELARLDGGKIAESWSYSNGLELLAQLGLFAPPEPTVRLEKKTAQ